MWLILGLMTQRFLVKDGSAFGSKTQPTYQTL